MTIDELIEILNRNKALLEAQVDEGEDSDFDIYGTSEYGYGIGLQDGIYQGKIEAINEIIELIK